MTITIDLLFVGIIATLITFVGFLMIAGLKKHPRSEDEAGDLFDFDVYGDQLDEIKSDLEQGRIDKAEADALRLEIERRLLRADRQARDHAAKATQVRKITPVSKTNRQAMNFGLCVFVPLSAIVLYLYLGAPGFPGAPFDQRQGERDAAARQSQSQEAGGAMGDNMIDQKTIEKMVTRLAARLKEDPNDPKGWEMLGRSYVVLGRPDEAEAILAQGLELFPDNMELLSQRARLLIGLATPVEASEPVVPAEAAALFNKILKSDPDNMDALWFGGMREAQSNNKAAAITMWERLLTLLPQDHDIRKTLETLIDELKKDGE